MGVEDIFADVSSRMIQGLMFHDQLSQMFAFLGLETYERDQEEQYYEESKNYRDLCHYYITRTNKMIPQNRIDPISVIPDIWYDYTRMDVSYEKRKQFVKDIFEKWASWERDTKRIYEDAYSDLIVNHKAGYASHILGYVVDVEIEIARVEKEYLKLKATDFDMPTIVDQQ